MEILDIVDKNGNPTGETADRKTAHEKGILHRTSHVWVFRENDGCLQVLLQKRSKNKDSYPGCYDISSAGHIPSGCGYEESAVRELKEELSLDASADELIFCKKRFIHYDEIFHGKRFIDNQVTNVYILWRNIDENDIRVQKEEIESVMWMPFDKCIKSVKENLFKHCIVMEELEILKEKLNIE